LTAWQYYYYYYRRGRQIYRRINEGSECSITLAENR
jgi:hypothetical protein